MDIVCGHFQLFERFHHSAAHHAGGKAEHLVGTGWECCYDLRLAESRDGLDWTLRPDVAIGLSGDEAGGAVSYRS